MGIFKRAVFSSVHYKKRFLLMLSILLIASVFLQVSYQIRAAASGAVVQIRKGIGASVIVHVEGKRLSGWDKTEFFPYNAALEISGLPEVKRSSYISLVNVLSEDIKGEEFDEEYHELHYPNTGDFTLIGISDMQSFWNFKNGKDHLIQGRLLSPDETGTAAVVSERVINTNVRKLDDMFTVSSYFDNDQSAKLKIVGVHSGNELNMMPEFDCNVNYIYTPLEVAVRFSGVNGITEAEYQLIDPAELDSFLIKAKAIADKDGLALEFINDNLDFLLASTALNSLIKTCDAIYITVIAMSAIILSLLVIYMMNDRLFEIGVLLSLGESRFKISIQMILEILIPAILAINFGSLISSIIISTVDKAVAAGMHIDQPLTSANVGMLFLLANGCGILLVVIASIIPTIAIRKYTPKRIMQTFK